MTPKTVSDLAKSYDNVFMVKDSSGEDKIAMADADYSGITLVRGAEGDYASHMKEFGGTYDGLLLSTVNSFPQALGAFIQATDENREADAKTLSDNISLAIKEGFELVGNITAGNAFANANKCFDYWNAFGRDGNIKGLPMLHEGVRIGIVKLDAAREILRKTNMLANEGYVIK